VEYASQIDLRQQKSENGEQKGIALRRQDGNLVVGQERVVRSQESKGLSQPTK
jgi:hypothetical protein